MGEKQSQDAPWKRVVLEHGELYLVGGVVRDMLMGATPSHKDEDYVVTGVPLEELMSLLASHGRVDLVGKSFGVIKFQPKGEDHYIDVALPRREVSSGVGHRDFVVETDHTLSIENDLQRRDFTVNAMAQDERTGKLVDPLGGRKDLASGLIRMIGGATIPEDPLRSLRAVQFAARFDFQIESGTLEAMRLHADLVATVSPERIQEELVKLLTRAPKPSIGFRIMESTSILGVMLPELEACRGVDQGGYHFHDVYVHSLLSCDATTQSDLVLRLAALLHDIGKPESRQVVEEEDGSERVVFYGHEDVSAGIARHMLTRFRFSGEITDAVCHLIEQHMFSYSSEWSDSAVRRFVRRIGIDYLDAMFALREADRKARGGPSDSTDEALKARVREEIERGMVPDVRSLAVDGNDVMRILGVSQGPAVGAVLDWLLEIVTEDPSLNNEPQLLDMIREQGPDIVQR